MAITLSNIVCVPTIPKGGIKSLWVIPVRDVTSLPTCDCNTTDYLITDPIGVPPDKGFVNYEFEKGTLGYNFEQVTTEHGSYFDTELKGDIRTLRKEVAQEICKLKEGHYIVVTEDYLDNVRLHGSLDYPMYFEGAGTTGPGKTDPNKYIFRFYGKSSCPHCYMDPNQTIPYRVDLALPPVARLGSLNGTTFVEGQDAKYTGGVNHTMVLAGLLQLKDGKTPCPPTAGASVSLEIYHEKTNGVLVRQGKVVLPYSSRITLGDAVPANNTAPSSDESSIWDTYKSYFNPGSGTDLNGNLSLSFNKGAWASANSKTDKNAVGIYIKLSLTKDSVESAQSAAKFPTYITGVEYAEFADMDYTDLGSDTFRMAADLNMTNYSVNGDYQWKIDGNVFQGAGASALSIPSPVAGTGNITAIGGTYAAPEVTYGNNTTPFTHLLECEVDVIHTDGTTGTLYWRGHVGTANLSAGIASSVATVAFLSGPSLTLTNTSSVTSSALFIITTATGGYGNSSDLLISQNGNTIFSAMNNSMVTSLRYYLNPGKDAAEIEMEASFDHTSSSTTGLDLASNTYFKLNII